MEQLRAVGAAKVYREKRGSGARADRVQLRQILAQLDKGDVLTVTEHIRPIQIPAYHSYPRSGQNPPFPRPNLPSWSVNSMRITYFACL
jgi:hypothetical protein